MMRVSNARELAVGLKDRAAGGGEPQDAVLGGVQGAGGPAQRGGCARADLAGDQADGAQAHDVVEALGKFVQGAGLESLLAA